MGRHGGFGPYFPATAGPGVVSCYSLLMVSSLPKGGEEAAPILGASKQPLPTSLHSLPKQLVSWLWPWK